MNSNPKEKVTFLEKLHDNRIQTILVMTISVLVGLIFIFIGNLAEKPGFPLDDAWIHQTYARNLAETGEWQYVIGESSAGSTAPLWTMLLSFGTLFQFQTPYIWTSFLSLTVLCGIGFITQKILNRFFPNSIFPLIGSVLIILDWHILWSAASGMETLLYCFLGLCILYFLMNGKNWWMVGVLCGLIIWTRPDGITFLGPALLVFLDMRIKKEIGLRKIFHLLLPLMILIVLYVWFNYSLSGNILPNTFYAKQIEYATELTQPIIKRMTEIFLVPLSGAGIFFFPGLILAILYGIKKRNAWLISSILWLLGYGLIYTIRLPLVYQHGRYLIPLITIYYLVGLIGIQEIRISGKYESIKKYFSARVWIPAIILCALVFDVFGEMALIGDIKTINSLMVEPALWVHDHTDENAIVAVHDIGAMGYYGGRRLIDLAGLIQPELISMIRNEYEIQAYLLKGKADYLVSFTDWYPNLTHIGIPVKQFELSVGGKSEIVEIQKIIH